MITALALAAQLTAGLPEVIRTARVDPRQGVNFAAAVVPETVTVGQQALYQVAVFVSDEVRQRLRRNPEFVPPELRAVLAYDPPGAYTRYERVRLGGRDWEAHVFQRVIFPLAAGRVDVPPARLSYALPLSSSFFSREETYSVRSPAVRLEAVDPPRDGRPTDWSGAVGRVALEAQVSPRRVRVGDPVTVAVRVRGAGNVNLWPRPTLDLPWADVVPAGERVVLDSVRLRVEGTKTFEWVVTPRRAGRHAVGVTRYPVYEPGTRGYVVAFTTPESLEVQGGAAVAGAAPAPSSNAPTWLPVRTTWRGERGPPPWRQWPFWGLVLLAPAAVTLERRRRQRRRSASAGVSSGPTGGSGSHGVSAMVGDAAIAASRAGTAPQDAAAAAAAAARAAFDTWHRGLRALVAIPVGADAATVARALRRAGVTAETAAAAVALEATLAAGAFGGGRPVPRPAGRDADTRDPDPDALLRQLQRELATRRPAPRPGTRALLWLVAFAGSAALAAAASAADDAETRFAAGVRAYAARDAEGARRAFADAARLAPRAPDAWANLGTVAWMVADTGVAAMAWQRALRLTPEADDVRERLEALPGMRAPLLAPETVWPVGSWWLAWAAGIAWAILCALAAWAPARGGPGATGIGAAAAVAAALAALAAIAAHRERADGLVVVARGDRLRTVPALGADPVAAVSSGEVGAVRERRDDWVQVTFGDGRAGWLEAPRVLGLAQARPGDGDIARTAPPTR